MEERHPSSPDPNLSEVKVEAHQVVVHTVVDSVRQFSNVSAGGMSGLRPAHLRFLCSAVGLVDVQTRMTDVVNRMLSGTLPPLTRQFVCGANLSALLKKDGGLRPIACGDVWRRLTARCVCKDLAPRFAHILSPHQFGVAVKGGLEALVHTARVVQELARGNSDFFLLKFDFQNAFNMVSRQAFLDEVRSHFPEMYRFVSTCYGTSSVLRFGERQLSSTCGVQQGDPLGPLLFCLAIRPVVEKIATHCPSLTLNGWYLDDGVVAGSEEEVIRALEIIQSDGLPRGLVLNSSKSEVWSSGSPVPSRLRHFKALESEGFELLGSPVGSESFSEHHFQGKVTKFRSLWKSISTVPHLQTQALLLRFCASFCKVVHLVRTVPTHLIRQGVLRFDHEFRLCMEDVLGCVDNETWSLMALGCKKGGLGLRSASDHACGAYLASLSSSLSLVGSRFPSLPGASLSTQVSSAREAWSSRYGELPSCLTQRALSERTDDVLLSRLPALPPPAWLASIQTPTSSCF